MRSLRILSGGQTGADRAALDFAIDHDLPHGGWCPRGRMAEDGPLEPRYHLRQTPSWRYAQRTAWNVRDGDATVIFSMDREVTGGTRLTQEVCERLDKPYLHLPLGSTSVAAASDELREFLIRHQVEKLNVAGPRASQEPAIASLVYQVLQRALLTGSNAEGAEIKPGQSEAIDA